MRYAESDDATVVSTVNTRVRIISTRTAVVAGIVTAFVSAFPICAAITDTIGFWMPFGGPTNHLDSAIFALLVCIGFGGFIPLLAIGTASAIVSAQICQDSSKRLLLIPATMAITILLVAVAQVAFVVIVR